MGLNMNDIAKTLQRPGGRSAGNTATAALAKLSRSRPEVASLLSKEMIPCAAEKHIIG